MEKIITKAWSRFKKNWLKYFLVYILSLLVSVASLVLVVLSIGLAIGAYFLFGQNLAIGLGLGIGLFLVSIFILIYFSSLFTLAQNLALIKKNTQNISTIIKTVRPLTLSFVVFNLLSGLFMLGIFYTNILLFVPFILWSVWGLFSTFAFLDGHRGGLAPLWYSRSKVQGNFGKVFSYVLMMVAVFLLIAFFFTQLDSRYQFMNLLSFLFFIPFGICLTYELYLSLPEPTKVKTSIIWIVLSVFGYALIIGAILISIQNLPKLLKELPLGNRGNIMKQEIPGIKIPGWQEN